MPLHDRAMKELITDVLLPTCRRLHLVSRDNALAKKIYFCISDFCFRSDQNSLNCLHSECLHGSQKERRTRLLTPCQSLESKMLA